MSVDKLLAGVARELLHRHFSAAELRTGTDLVGHVHRAAQRANVTRARLDLASGRVEPPVLDGRDVQEGIAAFRADLRHLLRDHGIGPDHVAGIHAELEFGEGEPPAPRAAGGDHAGYRCAVEITDARGKRHVAALPAGWTPPPPPPTSPPARGGRA
jgi:hypothetical protein